MINGSCRRFLFPLLLAALAATALRAEIEYPETRVVDHVDTYHGVEVRDPYRWLEDDNSDETKAWVAAQNEVTFAYLRGIKYRDSIRDRLEKLINFERFGVPSKEAGRYFYKRNSGLQNQSVLYVTDSLDGEPRELLDPNTLSEDGTVSLADQWVSPDGKLMAYSISTSGSDWRTIRVRDVASGKDLATDEIKWAKFTNAAWTANSAGFFYRRQPTPEEGKEYTAKDQLSQIYFHTIGTPQDNDKLVYQRPDRPEWRLYSGVSDDKTLLLIYVGRIGTVNNGYFFKRLNVEGESPVIEVFNKFDASYWFVGNDGDTLYFVTTNGAPNRRIVAVDMNEPGELKEVVPESKYSIEDVSMIGDRFVVHYLRRAQSELKLFKVDGTFERNVPLPGVGSVGGSITGHRKDREMFFAFTGFTFPSTILRYDFDAGKTSVFKQPKVAFDPDDFEAKQVAYKSKDGTYVTMFITHKKGLKLDGTAPTILYGYGGFNNSMTPWFSTSRTVWMEMGGVWAMPNLRGGGEYGEKWHRAGMREQKQNTFDDFIAAAESLIANKYTSAKKIAIAGGSNGGLLVGACMTQRPELFGACLPSVGVMDMLRYHKFTVGASWAGEYGSSDEKEMFPILLKYSPYHNLKKGVKYPPTLVTTADHDDRVVPAHSFKFAARLQACQAGPAPVLIRIETKAGHGAGTPISKILDERADEYAFLIKNLDIKVPRSLR